MKFEGELIHDNKFDTAADQIDRDFDQFELESKKSGSVFQLIARYAFD